MNSVIFCWCFMRAIHSISSFVVLSNLSFKGIFVTWWYRWANLGGLRYSCVTYCIILALVFSCVSLKVLPCMNVFLSSHISRWISRALSVRVVAHWDVDDFTLDLSWILLQCLDVYPRRKLSHQMRFWLIRASYRLCWVVAYGLCIGLYLCSEEICIVWVSDSSSEKGISIDNLFATNLLSAL